MEPLSKLPTSELLSRTEATARADALHESEEYWALVRELHARGDEDTFRHCVAWSESAERALRGLAADVLGQLGHRQSCPYAIQSEPILTRLFRDADVGVVASAVLACSHWRLGATASIVALAAHADANVRRAVAVCLGTREDESALTALIGLSGDIDRDVRDWGTFGLASMSDANTPELRDALTTRLGDTDSEVRGEAMVGLARRGIRDVIPAILKDLAGSATVLAIEAAGELPDATFVPELERLFVATPDNEELAEALDRCRDALPS